MRDLCRNPFLLYYAYFPPSLHTAGPQVTIPSQQGDAMDLERLVGEQRIFTCTIAGVPTPTVTWYHDNVQLNNGGRIVITRVSPSTATLTISDLTEGDTGMYQCIASNVVGRTQASWALQVRTPSEGITHTHTHIPHTIHTYHTPSTHTHHPSPTHTY